jgi:DNA repair exonuclease SbcCD ATPase subunit
MDKFKNLAGKVCCPTCDQELQDMTGFIDNLNTQIIDLKSRQIKINNLYSQALHKSKLAQEEAGKMEIIVRRIAYLTEEWNKLSEVEFSKDKYDSISKSILDLKIIQASIQSVNQRISELTTEIRVLNEKLSNLSIYDGNVTIEEELTVLDSAIKGDERIKEEINEFKLEAGKLEHELLLLEQRIKTSEDNSVYNLRRKEYLSSLTAAYDIFHASQFPRKLIESYMDHVQVYLANYLEYFNLPYSVRVEDGFKIRLYEPEGVDPLPRVSGGQEMMVGICLRLALHKMFAKAFSLWLIDEGTTHLSESKKQNYFDLIDELRNQKVIKQIIIIDHDERLANVVDQIIEL